MMGCQPQLPPPVSLCCPLVFLIVLGELSAGGGPLHHSVSGIIPKNKNIKRIADEGRWRELQPASHHRRKEWEEPEKSFSLPYFRLEPIPGPVPPDLKLPEEVGEILLDLIRSEQDLILGWLDWLAAWVYILPENPYLSLPEILIFPW